MKILAKVISRLFGPFLGYLCWPVLIIVFSNASIYEMIWQFVVLESVALTVPVAYLIIAFKRHFIEDVELSKREQRPVFFFLVAIFYSLATVVAFWLKFPEEVIGVFFVISVSTFLYSIVTVFWKISLHILSVVIWTSLLAYIFGPWWFFAGLSVVPVAWARIYLKLHSVNQVVVSFFLASLLMMFAFAFYPRHEYSVSELCRDKEKFIEVEGVKIHYIDKGQGEPILFLHGFALSAQAWTNQLEMFSKYYRVIALDLPGFGYSARSAEIDYSRRSQAIFVDKFMEALHITKATVVGHSMGGGIAAQLALLFPERVKKLILVDSAGYEKVPERWGAVNLPIFDRFVARYFIMNRFAARRLMTKAYYDDRKINNDLINNFLKFSYVKNSLQTLIKMALDQTTGDLPKKIKNIKQKTFIIWGQYDEVLTVAWAERFHFDIKNSELVIMPDVGHMPFMERPDQFNAHVAEFLKK